MKTYSVLATTVRAPGGKPSQAMGRQLFTGIAAVLSMLSIAPVLADATIGSLGGDSWAGFWRTSADLQQDPWGRYAIITNGSNTYINAPNVDGNIFFRGGNGGSSTTAIKDPDGWWSRMYLDSKSDLHVAGTVYGGQGPVLNFDSSPEAQNAGVVGKAFGISSGVIAASEKGHAIMARANRTKLPGVFASPTGILADGHTGGRFDGSETGIWVSGVSLAAYFSGKVEINGNLLHSGTITNTSDERVKKDIVDFKAGLADLEKIHVVKFKYNGLGGTPNTGEETVGVLAQEVEKILPFMVSSQEKKLRENDEKTTSIKQINSSAFTYLLVNAVQELNTQNKELAAQNAEHGKKLVELAEQNKKLAALTEQNRMLTAVICKDHPTEAFCSQSVALK